MGEPGAPLEPASREQAAFLERAMTQYGTATYNFAFRLTGNETDARDLTQDAFVRVYRAWRSFQPGTSFLSWIYRIVTNLYRDELRRRKGRFYEEIPEDNAPQEFGGQRPLAVNPIDDYVDRWHDGGTGLMLWEYLGMTRSEYGRWVADADKLEAILVARGFAQPVHGAAGA